MADSNLCARAHSWLSRSVRAYDVTLWHSWHELLRRIVNDGPTVIWSEPWPHDYWVAQGVRLAPGAVQTWRHEGDLDVWPRLEVAAGSRHRVTNSATLAHVAAAAEPLDYDHRNALTAFASYARSGVSVLAEPQLIRSWLSSVLGTGLSAIVLSPTEDEVLIESETIRRLQLILEARKALGQSRQMDVAYQIEALYTAAWNEGRPTLVQTHQGESIESRDFWFWMSRPSDAARIRDALHVAARLLVCPPMMQALLNAASKEDELSILSRCVLRRWALGLRAAAWLEQALAHHWHDVRVADLVSFAFASIAPWWPRPSVAISHRSRDAKPHLKETAVWANPHFAIDAMTVPNWESNTGFVWRLFAASPAVVRVLTDHYAESRWCRREAELTDYLLDHSDFLGGRITRHIHLG